MNIPFPYDVIYTVAWLAIVVVTVAGLALYNDWSCNK